MTNRSNKINQKRLTIGAFFMLAAVAYLSQQIPQNSHSKLVDLYTNKQSGQMLEVAGKVLKILSDDNQGSRHQRFIIKSNNLTVLIAHNIDLAQKIPVDIGDQVLVYGQYEWNNQGGVIHWTHYDPQGKHEGGWIKHEKKVYGKTF